jgi:hypothetical protein
MNIKKEYENVKWTCKELIKVFNKGKEIPPMTTKEKLLMKLPTSCKIILIAGTYLPMALLYFSIVFLMWIIALPFRALAWLLVD